VKRSLVVACLLLAGLAGCGGDGDGGTTTTAAPSPAQALAALARAGRVDAPADARARTLYRSGEWAVATLQGDNAAYAAALRLTGGRWRADLSRAVKIRILGPEPGEQAAATPQVAVELTSSAPLAESGLWVDGVPLDVKGGGTATRGTIYGAPAMPLEAGQHVAVAFARTARSGTAVAWTFTV
jgi:hypothetical protein